MNQRLDFVREAMTNRFTMVPSSALNAAATSLRVTTSGSRRPRLARTTCSPIPRGMPRTS